MDYTKKLQNVSVLGAAGKMGSGILLLSAIEMTDLSLQSENKDKTFTLNAIDVSQPALKGLMKYLNVQVRKIAEKKIGSLRKWYSERNDLIENGEIINEYIFDVLNTVQTGTKLEAAYESNVIFEAIKEDPALKVKILGQINKNSAIKPWFFTNTSSIPIGNLDKDAGLDGRIIGFHFYNPPAVQRLVELIKSENTLKEVEDFALEYAKKLKKVVVPSNDFAGFIGNGHFMRDALFGIQKAEELAKEIPLEQAVLLVNKISQEYLVRPMGIFQLIDYVGVDVCQYIMSVMNPYLENEDLHSDLLNKMIELGIKGGQNSDGSQKDGFLKYKKERPIAVYSIDNKNYTLINDFYNEVLQKIEKTDIEKPIWKAMIRNKNKETVFSEYFSKLKKDQSFGSKLAVEYLKNSKNIGLKLVEDKVAFNNDDVNTVMLTGFFHAYGPINEYV